MQIDHLWLQLDLDCVLVWLFLCPYILINECLKLQ